METRAKFPPRAKERSVIGELRPTIGCEILLDKRNIVSATPFPTHPLSYPRAPIVATKMIKRPSCLIHSVHETPSNPPHLCHSLYSLGETCPDWGILGLVRIHRGKLREKLGTKRDSSFRVQPGANSSRRDLQPWRQDHYPLPS